MSTGRTANALPLKTLAGGATRLGVTLSPAQLDQFALYRDELLAWNRRANLTAITDPAEVEIKHFLDSLTVLQAMDGQPRCGLRVIDVGSGAGLPGLPLKIACPNISLTLLESVGKKTAFLEHVVAALGLKSVAVIHARAEDVAQQEEHREAYDFVVARAVAPMATLGELTLPLCAVGGTVIAMKSANVVKELGQAAVALEVLGGRLRHCVPVALQGLTGRTLVVLDKLSTTPDRYPRRAGMPKKRPLG